jgi:hypothetical protein
LLLSLWRDRHGNAAVSVDVRRAAFETTDPAGKSCAHLCRRDNSGDDMASEKHYRIAVLWRGDRESRRAATPHNNRFHRVFEELAALGIHAEPAVYADDIADEVREQLLSVDGVLVWVDPIHQGQTRTELDAMLRDVASRGPWVSAHPDVILKMGVKEVLYRTKHLGWGTDTQLYRTAAEFDEAFPSRLESASPRVLKQNRGNGGQGVWKVELISGPASKASVVRVLHALRGSVVEEMSLGEFMTRCEPYLASDGCLVDQPFQPRLPDGMIRCYMGCDKVVGFGHQFIKALIPPPPEGPDSPDAQPGLRIMHGADAEPFQVLRAKMEAEWTPQMMEVLGIDAASLPIIWDADFLYGPRMSGEDSYVLCEINVSSVFAIPDQAPAAIARLALNRLRSA